MFLPRKNGFKRNGNDNLKKTTSKSDASNNHLSDLLSCCSAWNDFHLKWSVRSSAHVWHRCNFEAVLATNRKVLRRICMTLTLENWDMAYPPDNWHSPLLEKENYLLNLVGQRPASSPKIPQSILYLCISLKPLTSGFSGFVTQTHRGTLKTNLVPIALEMLGVTSCQCH